MYYDSVAQFYRWREFFKTKNMARWRKNQVSLCRYFDTANILAKKCCGGVVAEKI